MVYFGAEYKNKKEKSDNYEKKNRNTTMQYVYIDECYIS